MDNMKNNYKDNHLNKALDKCYDSVNSTYDVKTIFSNFIDEKHIRKVNIYTGDVDEQLNNGVVYYFTHYLIHLGPYSHNINSFGYDEITFITEYNEDLIVLIKRSDMSQKGFNLFLSDRLISNMRSINKIKIKASEKLENYKMYRDLCTLISFINKYNSNLNNEFYYYGRDLTLTVENIDGICNFQIAILPNKVTRHEFQITNDLKSLMEKGYSNRNQDIIENERKVRSRYGNKDRKYPSQLF